MFGSGAGAGTGAPAEAAPRRRVPQALGDQRFQRILGLGGVEVEYQPVPVGGDRRQGEDLRQRGALEVHHQPHDARSVLADADAGDVGIIRFDLRDQFAQFGVQVDALDVHRQPRRRGHEELLGRELLVRFDGHAGVVLRRPYAHRHDAGTARDLRGAEQEHQGPGAQQPAPRWAMGRGARRRQVGGGGGRRLRSCCGECLHQGCGQGVCRRAAGPAGPCRRHRTRRWRERGLRSVGQGRRWAAIPRPSRAIRPASGRGPRRCRENLRPPIRGDRRSGRSRNATPARRRCRAVRPRRRSGS